MTYKIDQIEGIGPAYAEKLQAAGVATTEALLEHGHTKKKRQQLAQQTGISEKLILTWVNHADLMRIKGVAGQFAELLEAAGVDTVKEFAHRKADNLQPKLVEINDSRKLCGRVPSVVEVQKMIDQAKELPPMVEY
ncbi:MAG: DUF4332 domain-containing protein [Candidatus Amulumruptor caecigallinarius]|nr:DUF4332 domain-containing protein [Candidatus Amulumruptor caecigallinarius]MCM1397494.1 DUF4332 domain-containing protein [Candidatus Amulumruptor caecigallinarius]MCM1454396.1 DUF4332 domain-containing protein [bacterium]